MTFTSSRQLQSWILILGLSLFCGCSSFDHDWNAAAGIKPQTPTDMTGRWQGEWISDANAHSGGLRCLITRGEKNTYHARYAATYGGIFHFNYEMDLTAEKQMEWIRFEGQADLGSMAGGIYHYDGH